ncbi:MAG TPA: riboflavin biosynthesis protein RibD, partial [Acidimicrobiaceae bacterium]|nr:riboflavin biosynthesis protein RibD [Acidimicrobiaceae bacterium]
GIAARRAGGVEVAVGECAAEITDQLGPYLRQRRTGRPWVVLKLAATADGATATPDAGSRWITGHAARADAHRLRARCDTVLVGAGTVRADDPALTVRHCDGTDPRRVVLGRAPDDAAVRPCWELAGEPADVLDELGRRGVVELLVEGGATVAAGFHRAGLVDEYVLYLAPALTGGDDARRLFAGPGAATMDDLWRGEFVDVTRLGDDLRVTLRPPADFRH